MLLNTIKRELYFLQREIQKELTAQGHRLTGKLIDTIHYTVRENAQGYIGRLFMQDYGLYVERGVRANRIPYGKYTGRKTSKYIQGLIRFFKIKGKSDKESKRLAFMTANAHKREGMPTRASYRFSRNGRRVGAVRYVLENKINLVEKRIESEFGKDIELNLLNLLENVSKKG